MIAALDKVLVVCPHCGAAMHVFETFPARNGLPEVDVFACDTCEGMILQDRIQSPAVSRTDPSS